MLVIHAVYAHATTLINTLIKNILRCISMKVKTINQPQHILNLKMSFEMLQTIIIRNNQIICNYCNNYQIRSRQGSYKIQKYTESDCLFSFSFLFITILSIKKSNFKSHHAS